jgi:S-adenosylmethionine decarboxylase
MHFGEHLTIDGYDGNHDKLNDRDLVFSCLNDLPELMGMTKLSEPSISFAPGNNEKDPGGWSGYVIIMESHISVHTFPKRGFVSADVYTCKNGLDVKFVKNYFKEKFDLQELETNLLKRGMKYPMHNIA